MARWNIKPAALILLGGLVFVMLLIVVLPDVDLLDTAFHQDTAPVVVHARGTCAPAAVTVVAAIHLPDVSEAYRPFYQLGAVAVAPSPNSIPISLRSIRL